MKKYDTDENYQDDGMKLAEDAQREVAELEATDRGAGGFGSTGGR
jgi:dUTPase